MPDGFGRGGGARGHGPGHRERQRQGQRLTELVVFERAGRVPVAAVALLWRASGGLDRPGTEDLLADLHDRSLVHLDAEAGMVTVPEALVDHARIALGAAAVRGLHGLLAGSYLGAWGGLARGLPRLAHPAPDSPPAGQGGPGYEPGYEPGHDDAVAAYGVTNVVAHLAAAGGADTVHRLLALEHRDGGADAAQDGLRVVNSWYTAHERFADVGSYLTDVRLAWRLAEQASDAALARGEPAATIALELRYLLIVASLVTVAANLPGALLRALVESGLWSPRRALGFARVTPSSDDRYDALAELLPHLEDGVRGPAVAEILAAARRMTDPSARAALLVRVAPHVASQPPPEALAAARAVAAGPGGLAETLAVLAPHLPPGVVTEMFAAARTYADPFERAAALVALAPCLPTGSLVDALAAARAITSRRARAEALAGLAPHLPDSLRAPVVADALAAARVVTSPSAQARMLAHLAPHLPARLRHALLRRALTTITLDMRTGQAEALARLAPHLPEDLLADALSVAGAITTWRGHAVALACLAPYLPADLMTEALAEATAIRARGARNAAVAALAPYLPAELVAAALAAARAVGDDDARDDALASALASGSPDGHVWPPWQWQVRAGDKTPARPARPARATPVIDDLADALVRARGAVDARDVCWSVLEMAPRLSDELRRPLLAEALASARMSAGYGRAEVLSALAPHVPPELMAEALGDARAIREDDARADALHGLAPYLPAGLLGDALDTACAIGDASSRATALGALAPYLPADLLSEALVAVRAVSHADERGTVIRALAVGGGGPDLAGWPGRWRLAGVAAAEAGREAALALVTAACPAVRVSGGLRAAEDVATAIVDVACWWP